MMPHQPKILNHEASGGLRPCSGFYWLQSSGEIEKCICCIGADGIGNPVAVRYTRP